MFKSVRIDLTSVLNNETQLLKALQKELREGLSAIPDGSLSRAVYVIRMTGDFLIAYERRNSPVLYIGRGNCTQRLAAHLKNWLHEVRGFGTGVGVEIRIASPRRQNRPDLFKNVEADLIAHFAKDHGSVPFFNRKYERKYAGKIRTYSPTERKEMRRAIIIGSGNRPQWALKPTKANKAFSTFMKGEHFE